MDEFLAKIIPQYGLTGLALYLLYRLLDKYVGMFVAHMGEFVKINAQQAQAIVDVATVVKESRDDQRDTVMAVRVMTQKLEEVVGWVKEIDQKVNSK